MLPVGQLQTNCYLVIDEDKCLIVDPGDDADYIQRVIADEEVKPTKIIATHGHFDHILAVTELKLAYKIPFLMHGKDEFLLKRMKSSAAHFSRISSDPPPKIDKYFKEGDKLIISHQSLRARGHGPEALTIVHTPGHTPGSISLYSKDSTLVFVGDLMFAGGGVGRTDFAYSNHSDLIDSIQKLLKFSSDTIVYSGHGEETTMGNLKKYFIKYDRII